MSKRGLHPFDWVEKRVKGTNRNPWKDISFEPPTSSRFTRCIVVVNKDTYFWDDQRWGRVLFVLCIHIFIACPLLKSPGYLMVWSKNFVSFSFGFRCNLSDRETMEVAYLLSLLEGCSFMEERDFRIWSPNPSQGFSCKSLFKMWPDPSFIRKSVFYGIWRIKVPKKISFFISQVLGCMNNVDSLIRRRTSLVGPFCCILQQKTKEDLDHLFWDY